MAGSPNFLKNRTGGDASRTQDNIAGQLGPVATALAKTPIMGAPLPAWIALGYAADFVDATAGGLQNTRYHRDALGYVWVRIGAQTAAGVGVLATITTLPTGFRPSSRSVFVGVNGTTGATNSIFVEPTGIVRTVPAIAAGQSVLANFAFLADG